MEKTAPKHRSDTRPGSSGQDADSVLSKLRNRVLAKEDIMVRAQHEYEMFETECYHARKAYNDARIELFIAVIAKYRDLLRAKGINWKRGLGDDELLLNLFEKLGAKIVKGRDRWLLEKLRRIHLRGRSERRLRREVEKLFAEHDTGGVEYVAI